MRYVVVALGLMVVLLAVFAVPSPALIVHVPVCPFGFQLNIVLSPTVITGSATETLGVGAGG